MNIKQNYHIWFVFLSFTFLLPGFSVAQDFTLVPQTFTTINRGWLNLLGNPALMVEGAGSYSGFIIGNFPSASVRTNTGIMGYDGGYELSYRHNSQHTQSFRALTGYDMSFFLGKIGFGLFPAGIRTLNLNLYSPPIGYYDSLPSETLPHFDWTFTGRGYGVVAGAAGSIGKLKIGASLIYSGLSFKMSHIVMLHYNEINDSIHDIPIQFAYIPDYREATVDGKSFAFKLGLSFDIGRLTVGVIAGKYEPITFSGYAGSRIYLPIDTLLAEEIDSTFFSGGVISILGGGFIMKYPGHHEYALTASMPVGTGGVLKLGVQREVWMRPTSMVMKPMFRDFVLINHLLDTFNFKLQDTWAGEVAFEYKTMNRSKIAVGVRYRTPLIDSSPYMPLFWGAGSLIEVKFGFSYLVTDDLSLDVRYRFSRNSDFMNNSRLLSPDNLAGEYISSNDMLAIGFSYIFPEN